MKVYWIKINILIILIIIIDFIIISDILAENTFYPKEGIYMSLNIPYNSIEGDFDGDDDILVGQGEVILIPNFKSNFGYGISLGARFRASAFEISYLRSNHDVNFFDFKSNAIYQMVSCDCKLFSNSKKLQPYFLFGLCFPWIHVKDYRFTGEPDNEESDVSFSDSFGLNIGLGLEYYFSPRVSIAAETIYRKIRYKKAGSTESGVISNKIEGELDGSGLNFNFGLKFTFYAFDYYNF